MKRITRKLALDKEIVRNLAIADLGNVQGGATNLTVSNCEGGRDCHPERTDTCTVGTVCATGPRPTAFC